MCHRWTRRLQFLTVDNDQIIGYVRVDQAGCDVIVVVVNLDPHHMQSGHVILPLERFGIDPS